MESKRQKKLARQLQKDLSDILHQHSNLWGRHLITVTVVRVSGDLGVAKVYLSIFPVGKGEPLEILDLVQENTVAIRQELAHKIRHQVRRVPELFFLLDDTQDEVAKIDTLFNKIDIPEEGDDSDL